MNSTGLDDVLVSLAAQNSVQDLHVESHVSGSLRDVERRCRALCAERAHLVVGQSEVRVDEFYRVRQMSISAAGERVPDVPVVDTQFTSTSRNVERPRRVFLSQRRHVGISEGCARCAFAGSAAVGVATSRELVVRVLLRRPDVKMIDIHTRRCVAVMADKHALRDRPTKLLPDPAMACYGNEVSSSPSLAWGAEDGIAVVSAKATGPKMTARFIDSDLLAEAFHRWARSSRHSVNRIKLHTTRDNT